MCVPVVDKAGRFVMRHETSALSLVGCNSMLITDDVSIAIVESNA